MPRKKGKSAKDLRKKQKNKRQKKSLFDLHPDVVKGVWGVFFVVFSIFIGLSFVGSAGVAGEVIIDALRWVFGMGVYIVPFVLIVLASVFFTSFRRNVYLSSIIGVLLFFSSCLGFLALTNEEHMRGGAWGFAVVFPLLRILGVWGTALVLLGFLASSIFVGLNIPPSKLFRRNKGEEEGIYEEDEGVKVKSFIKDTEDDERKYERRAEDDRRVDEGLKEDKDTFAIFPRLRRKASFRGLPLNLLEKETGRPDSGDIVASANIIKRTLANFGIDIEMGEVNVGPTVTQFTLKPAEGVKLSRITALHNDLALALSAHPIRIEAPIPRRALVGIEVPNRSIATVRLRDLFEAKEFQKSTYSLPLALGRDVSGTPVYADLSKMPHFLVAGSTGSGKTIALNALILSLLYSNPPELLRFILIDPKRVEFPVYRDIPHLLAPIVVDSQKSINALRWAVGEMERRFEILAKANVRDVQGYNSSKDIVEHEGYLPYVIIVIDELADIMASRGKEAEALIVRIAQMARAVGIHLVLATQRPSVEVITGLIKANITARIAFQVASQVDSRTILDGAGAEKLLGNGDMLYLAPEDSKPKRIQGAFVSEKEIGRVADFLRKEARHLGESVAQQEDFDEVRRVSGIDRVDFDDAEDEWHGDDDILYEAARRVVIESNRASASLLQRRLRVGYARAARLIDMLEERGVVGPGSGAKPREVYHEET